MCLDGLVGRMGWSVGRFGQRDGLVRGTVWCQWDGLVSETGWSKGRVGQKDGLVSVGR